MTHTNQPELQIEEELEEEAYVTYDIATYPSDFTLSGIVEMWENNDITIPDFQREFVWNIKQSSLLIESFLLGLPVPPVFFYIDDDNKNLVIDGQQRILSTVFYFQGLFGFENSQNKRQVFRLQGISHKSPYYRKTFDELEQSAQRKLKNAVLRAINIRQLSPISDSTSAYHIFERLNTGGTPLKSQEIRNVVFRGGFVSILRELNQDKNWRYILGTTTPNKYQVDVEILLRVFALRDGVENYKNPMKEFLNEIMNQHRTGNTEAVREFKLSFTKIAGHIVDTLGVKPFHLTGRLNLSILDSVFCTLLKNEKKIPEDLPDRYQKLIINNDFLDKTSRSTTDISVITKRFDLAQKYLID